MKMSILQTTFSVVSILGLIAVGQSVSVKPKALDRRSNNISKIVRTTTESFLILDKSNNWDNGNNNWSSEEDSGETFGKITTSQQDANKFVDDLLQRIRTRILHKGYDKLALPNESREFTKKVLGVKFHGEGKLYNGTLTGLETVRRAGDAVMNNFANGSLRLDFDVKLDDLDISYNLKIRFMDRLALETLNAELVSVTTHLRLLIDNNGKVTLDHFEITDTGSLRIHTRGLGPFNFVVNGLAEMIGNGVKGVVLESLQGRIKDLINNAINESMYPVRALMALSNMKESVFQKFVRMTKVARGFFETTD